jgi:hypothetical protein
MTSTDLVITSFSAYSGDHSKDLLYEIARMTIRRIRVVVKTGFEHILLFPV